MARGQREEIWKLSFTPSGVQGANPLVWESGTKPPKADENFIFHILIFNVMYYYLLHRLTIAFVYTNSDT